MQIVKNTEWGMRNLHLLENNQSNPNQIVIHHMGAGKEANIPIWIKYGSDYCIKSVEKHHIGTNRWFALGYHFVVMPDGKVYEGRDMHTRGAHVKNHNLNKIGILVYGNFDYESVTKEQKESLRELVQYLQSKLNLEDVKGHRDFANTKCPGNDLYLFVQELNLLLKDESPHKQEYEIDFSVNSKEAILHKIEEIEKQFQDLKNLIKSKL